MSGTNAAAQLVYTKEINHFRESFQRVFLALQKSSSSNKELINKCRLLGRKLADSGTKLNKLLVLKQKDDGLVNTLRFELKEAWMTSETYRSRENAANKLVKQMKAELDKLKAEVNRLYMENKQLKEANEKGFSRFSNTTTMANDKTGSLLLGVNNNRSFSQRQRPATSGSGRYVSRSLQLRRVCSISIDHIFHTR